MTRLSLVCVLFVLGCATPPPPMSTAPPHGAAPMDAEAERVARAYLARLLKDPDSLKQFRVYTPADRCTFLTPLAAGGARWESGWAVRFEYNAKNSYGAYTGLQYGGLVLRCSAPDRCWHFHDMPRMQSVGC